MNILNVSDITIQFGGIKALDSVSFKLNEGEILAMIGPNGAGKTTLFNIVAGVYKPTHGEVTLRGENITGKRPFYLARKGLTRTFQNLQIFYRMSAIENVMVGRHLHERRNPIAHLLSLPFVRKQNRTTREKAQELLNFVGLGRFADQEAGEMPYGALKRLEIARALAVEPSVLLLDEPVAGCNAVESADVAAVIRKVADSGVSVLLVEHDMHLVMKLADRVHVLERGKTLAQGTPEEVKVNPAVIEAYLGISKEKEISNA